MTATYTPPAMPVRPLSERDQGDEVPALTEKAEHAVPQGARTRRVRWAGGCGRWVHTFSFVPRPSRPSGRKTRITIRIANTIAPVHRLVLALEGLPFHRKGAPFEPGHPSRTRLLPALATRVVTIAQIHVPGLRIQGAPTARRPPHRFSIASPFRSLALAPIHELALRVQGAPTA